MVQLLIAGIIVVLAFVGYQSIGKVMNKGGGYYQTKTITIDASKETDISQIGNALLSFAVDHSDEFPATLDLLVTSGDIKSVPEFDGGYTYSVSADRASAVIYSKLESGKIYCWSSRGGARQVEGINLCQP